MTEYLKPSEVAKQLRVSTETIRNLCRSNKLSHIRIGGDRGAIRIHENALKEYLGRPLPSEQPTQAVGYSNLPGLNY